MKFTCFLIGDQWLLGRLEMEAKCFEGVLEIISTKLIVCHLKESSGHLETQSWIEGVRFVFFAESGGAVGEDINEIFVVTPGILLLGDRATSRGERRGGGGEDCIGGKANAGVLEK